MLKIILSGCCGKMGRVIDSIISEDSSCEIVAGVDPFGEQYSTFPVYPDFSALPEGDVIIDFSNPAALDSLITFAAKTKTPVVIATTGYTEPEIEKGILLIHPYTRTKVLCLDYVGYGALQCAENYKQNGFVLVLQLSVLF